MCPLLALPTPPPLLMTHGEPPRAPAPTALAELPLAARLLRQAVRRGVAELEAAHPGCGAAESEAAVAAKAATLFK